MFLGLCREKDIDLAKEDERPRSKGAEIPGYKAVVYRSDKSARVGGLSFAIDGGRNVMDLEKVMKKVYHDPIDPSTASSPPPPRPPKPSSSSRPAKGRMDAFLGQGKTKPASAPRRPKKRPEPQRRLDSYFGGGGSQKKPRRSATSDDAANESDAGPWACSKCTYLHENADEWGYLACNACGAPKQDGA
jgi:hypothetical protein